jgi:predicted class III extradiol MEMO1 family dioxygenase
MRVRAPAVAGSFYPADPAELRALVERCLSEAGPAPRAEPLAKALVAPHAGYVYSGGVAAAAYQRAARLAGRVSRVVLLGPAHRAFLRGLAAPRADAFATPLGVVPIDRPALDGLIDLPQLSLSDAPHAGEHSLEVQLPFLQVVLGARASAPGLLSELRPAQRGEAERSSARVSVSEREGAQRPAQRGEAERSSSWRLVPFVVGDASDEEVQEVIERLWGGAETLLVVSSDLSHYHDYESARKIDAESRRAVEALEPGGLGRESACGAVPVRGLLCAARRLGLVARTLDLRNSGDTAGGRQRVVGYGAWSFHPAAA